MKNKKILISCAGIAGLTLAYWLEKFGFEPTLIEIGDHLRNEGYMIDFFGSGYDVAEKMGILPTLQERDYFVEGLSFVNKKGETVAKMNIRKLRKLLMDRAFAFMRGDLEDTLYKKIEGKVPILFQTTITTITQNSNGVEVTFNNGRTEKFDLLVGADGARSNVRQIVFHNEKAFNHYLGYYTGAFIIENSFSYNANFYSYVEPGLQASIYAIRNNKLATFFVYKSEDKGWINPKLRKKSLMDTYKNVGWIIPELFDALPEDAPVFLDSLTQIKMKTWSKDRVTLIGDACDCVTLIAGQGSSLAMAGAYVLATELKKFGGDHTQAFAQYEKRLKPEVEKIQKMAEGLTGSFVPNTKLGIWFRNQFVKMMFWPGIRSFVLKQFHVSNIFSEKK